MEGTALLSPVEPEAKAYSTNATAGDQQSSSTVEVHKQTVIGVEYWPLSRVRVQRALSDPQFLSFLTLLAFMYVRVVAADYGTTNAIRAGGGGSTILLMGLLPLFQGIPLALATAELAACIPNNGGFLAWVGYAFHPVVYFSLMLQTIAWILVDTATFTTLFSNYICGLEPEGCSTGAVIGIRLGLVALCIIVNIIGGKYIPRIAIVLSVAIIAPLYIMFFWQAGTANGLQWDRLSETPKEGINLGLLVPTITWSFAGLESLGCFSEQVQSPSKTPWRTLLIVVVCFWVTAILPIVGFVSALPDLSPHLFEDQKEYITAAFLIGGSTAKGFLAVGGLAAGLGLTLTNLTICGRLVAGIGRTQFMTGKIASALAKDSDNQFHKPVTGILVAGILGGILCMPLDFANLVAIDQVLYGVRVLIIFFALIQLRWSKRVLNKPFSIPLSRKVLVGVYFLPICLTIATTIIAMTRHWVVPLAALLICFGSLFFAVILYFFILRHHFRGGRGGRDEEEEDTPVRAQVTCPPEYQRAAAPNPKASGLMEREEESCEESEEALKTVRELPVEEPPVQLEEPVAKEAPDDSADLKKQQDVEHEQHRSTLEEEEIKKRNKIARRTEEGFLSLWHQYVAEEEKIAEDGEYLAQLLNVEHEACESLPPLEHDWSEGLRDIFFMEQSGKENALQRQKRRELAELLSLEKEEARVRAEILDGEEMAAHELFLTEEDEREILEEELRAQEALEFQLRSTIRRGLDEEEADDRAELVREWETGLRAILKEKKAHLQRIQQTANLRARHRAERGELETDETETREEIEYFCQKEFQDLLLLFRAGPPPTLKPQEPVILPKPAQRQQAKSFKAPPPKPGTLRKESTAHQQRPQQQTSTPRPAAEYPLDIAVEESIITLAASPTDSSCPSLDSESSTHVSYCPDCGQMLDDTNDGCPKHEENRKLEVTLPPIRLTAEERQLLQGRKHPNYDWIKKKLPREPMSSSSKPLEKRIHRKTYAPTMLDLQTKDKQSVANKETAASKARLK